MHEKDAKGKAADFLSGLQAHLNKNLRLQTVKDWIHEKGKAANEGLFLEELVLPTIPTYLQQNLVPPAADTHDERIRKAFLAESTKVRDESLASTSPASGRKYLFTKVGVNPKQIVNLWWDKGLPCPLPIYRGVRGKTLPHWRHRARTHRVGERDIPVLLLPRLWRPCSRCGCSLNDARYRASDRDRQASSV
jgi:hypothetical protein